MVNQGIEYDPQFQTLAVALYPTKPIAYWSFDRIGKSYSMTAAWSRLQGFNLPIEDGLVAYWKMDEENATTIDWVKFSIEDNTTFNNDLTLNGRGGEVHVLRSFWGTKNRSIGFEENDTVGVVNNPHICDSSANAEFTFSFWAQGVRSEHNMDIHAGDFNVSILNNNISLIIRILERYSYQPTPQTFQDNGFIYFLGIRNKMRIFS